MDEDIYIVIVGDHPHTGERGHITVVDGKVTVERPLGGILGKMVRVELENCVHGVDGCFISPGQMRVLRQPKTAKGSRDDR